MSKPTEKRIYLTRHAQAEHNVAEDYSIPDAPLTALGRQQAAALNAATKETVQATAELLVTSGLRRTLSTTLDGYPVLRRRLEAAGKPIIVLPQLQEANDLPCDTGSDRATLAADPEYAALDLSLLTPDWNSKRGAYAASEPALRARARWVRRWLRARPERSIAVVAHGDLLRYITTGRNAHEPWANVEVREYTFASDDDGDEAWLVPVQRVAREGGDAPTSSEQARAR
ncbi:phosphoglycerate mutase-like protein [Lenzites betulinus]|nr:phosphoglycerate mutase-like protein [Lenzites betulinus]